jgi:hypothetical protein
MNKLFKNEVFQCVLILLAIAAGHLGIGLWYKNTSSDCQPVHTDNCMLYPF